MRKVLDNKIFQFIYKALKTIFVLILVLYVAILIIQRLSNNSSIFGFRVFTVATSSMEPVYEVGDVILVHEEDFKSLKVGDDVTYIGTVSDFKDRIVTHRIISKDEKNNTLRTKGVANEEADPTIESSQLYGKVTYRFIVISLITHLLRTKIGFYFLIFLPLVLVAFLEIADIFTKPKDDEIEEES